MTIKALFLDVANTLLYKPQLFTIFMHTLELHGIQVQMSDLVFRHRLLSESVVFPDKTSSDFYKEFNSLVLRSLGISPDKKLLDALFDACSYLPWSSFDDTRHLESISLPVGILSNWDKTLHDKLQLVQGLKPKWILGSEECRVRKPEPAFFQMALEISGLQADQVAYVGDSLRLDIEPALKMGLHAFMIDRENLYPNANVPRISNFSELAGRL